MPVRISIRWSTGDRLMIFVDSCVWIGALNRRDSDHAQYSEYLYRAREGEWGDIVTSDYVLDEVVTRAIKSDQDPRLAVSMGRAIIDSGVVRMIHVCEEDVMASWEYFQQLDDQGLSFTDCTIHHLLVRDGVGFLMTADGAFDGLGGSYIRIGPLD